MSWMNRFDVEECSIMMSRYEARGWEKAAIVLERLVEWTDENSDGWPYWTKPSAASKLLQDNLQRQMDTIRLSGKTDPLTVGSAAWKSMMRPIKSFMTRQNVDWKPLFQGIEFP